MGLIVPQTVKVRTNARTYKHYKEKGYAFEKCGDFIEVDVFDLPKGSNIKVKVICDICGKEAETWYYTIVECNKKNELITCRSNSCRNKKHEDTCMKKYGVKNPMQCKEIQDKAKDTNLERYGAENPFGSKEIQDKIKGTWQKNYGEGIINPFQIESVRDKIKKTWQKNYGEDIVNVSQVKEIRDKIESTCEERYGVKNPSQAQEIKDKRKKTWQENYGEDIANPFQLESVKEKSKQTLLKNYGTDNPFKSKEIQDKIKKTWQENYGENITHPMQVEEIKNKALDSFQFNRTGPSSRAQRYINHILNGILNKHICGLLVDIYMEKENIVIEHDGSGHFLTDKFNGNKTPTKESLLHEKEREDKIINNGYRMIRFIATKDRIPSDEVILNLVEGFKNSDFKVIRINFEEGTIDRDYEERWYCNFGELRKITKEDLEQFEKQEENI